MTFTALFFREDAGEDALTPQKIFLFFVDADNVIEYDVGVGTNPQQQTGAAMNTETETAVKIPLAVNIAVDAEFVHGMFTTALEGGINYWAGCQRYRWSKGGPDHEPDLDGFYAVVTEAEGGEDHRIDREVILRGIGRLFTGEYRGLHKKTAGLIMAGALNGEWGGLDAGDADALIQIGLFGEVVYG